MTVIRIAALLLILGGGLALAYGGFSYTRDTHKASVGPLELSVKDTQTVAIPAWAGVGLIVVGIGLLFAGRRKG